MNISLMQPYFLPYIGYFSLIKHSDLFIAFDLAQYKRRGWIHRNRILNTSGKPMYITVPTKRASLETKIKDILVDEEGWQLKILAQLDFYKKKAPYYKEVVDFLTDCFSYKTRRISDLNVYLLKRVCDYLKIDHNIKILSELHVTFEEVKASDEWGLYVTKQLGGLSYINLPSGKSFYNRDKYANHNIQIQFIENNIRKYNQMKEGFEPSLSIIDAMMFNHTEEIQEMLDDYQLS